MATHDEQLKELKEKFETAFEEMVDISCKFDEESEEVRAAEDKRAVAERELLEFCFKHRNKVA